MALFSRVANMDHFKLYTFVDISHTHQYKIEAGKEAARWKEQNFNTIIQTIGIRANISYYQSPIMTEIKGSLVGFDTDDIIRLWRFDFATEQTDCYSGSDGHVTLLKRDFNLVPYIQGLDELLVQKYAVFVTTGPEKNITFFKKN